MNASKMTRDFPDSWGVAISVKRALWQSNERNNQHIMSKNGVEMGRVSKKATQIVIFTEKVGDKKKALFTLFNETSKLILFISKYLYTYYILCRDF